MNLSNVKFNKIVYALTPPLFYRIFSNIYTNHVKRRHLVVDDLSDGTSVLNKFKKERINMFFNEQVIDEFCKSMDEHFNENKPINTKKPSNQGYLNELTKNGFCKIEGLFTKEQIKKWHDVVYSTMTAELPDSEELILQHGMATAKNIAVEKNNMKFNHELRSGIIRAWSISNCDPTIDACFRDHEDIHDICNSYLSGKANSADVYAEFKHNKKYKDPNYSLHADSVFKHLKVFLPLKAVKADNAPFVYYKKSHLLHEWRLLKDFLAYTNYNRRYNSGYALWGDPEMGRFADKYPELVDVESFVTTNEGDVIIADTRGVHGGSVLQEGYRLQLGLSYAMLGDFHNGYLPQHILNLAKNSTDISV